MKKIILVIFSLTLFNTMMSAQSKDEKEIIALMETLRKAMMNADKTVLENIASEDLSYGHSSGTLEDKAAFVDAIASRKNEFLKIDFPDLSVKFTKNNTALVRHKIVGDTRNDGKPGTVNIGVLEIFEKQKGQWKMVARQAYKL
jgi:ketosteroid isomerase-like protein